MPLLFSCLRHIAAMIDSLNDLIGRMVSWLTLIMVLITFCIVVLRYLFNISWVMMQESIIYLHGLVFMAGVAYTLKLDRHVRVDIIYQHCSARIQAWIDLLGTLFLLLPVAGFIFWSSWGYVMDSWNILESSHNSGGLPYVYLLKSYLLLMPSLLLLQGFAVLLNKIAFLFIVEIKPE